MGQSSARARRAAMVLRISGGKDYDPEFLTLDRHRSELELHVCGLPLDQRTKELRPTYPNVCHFLFRDRCVVRSVPWSGLQSCLVGTEVRPMAKIRSWPRVD